MLILTIKKFIKSKSFLINTVSKVRNKIYIIKRSGFEYREALLRRTPIINSGYPSIVFLSGFARSGTSLMKNYLGECGPLEILPFEKRGFHESWQKACSNTSGKILIDKNTHYIKTLKRIELSCRKYGAIACIVRDPRDVLLSLRNFDGHSGHSRIWQQHLTSWVNKYENYFQFSKNTNMKCYLVRYEDMVRYPVQVKQDFLHWVGVDRKFLDIQNTYNVAFTNDIQDPGVINNKGEIHTKSISKFKRLPLSEKEELTKHHHILMNKLGYTKDGITSPMKQNFPNIHFFLSPE